MKPNVGLVASARRVASFLGFLALGVSSAMAGDRALIDFIGFSPDARYFAFEEYGIFDGTGFAYSYTYVVDLEKDAWLDDMPLFAIGDDDNVPPLRAKARAEAKPILDDMEIGIPADIAALIGDGVPDTTAQTIEFGNPNFSPDAVTDGRQLSISTFPATAKEDCEGYFGAPPIGYELRLNGGAEEVVVHRDKGDLPASRGCVLDYRLYAVVFPWYGSSPDQGVAIISVYAGSFEGPTRRFLAVPFEF